MTTRTLKSLPVSEQTMLRVVTEFYAEYGAEALGYGRNEIAKKFGVSLSTVDALKAWHTMRTVRE
jgi:hypothetical protein